MSEDQLIDAAPKVREEFFSPNIHPAQERAVPACASDLITDRDINCELPHPVGLRNWKHVWMLTQAPSKNARPRTRRAHDKDRLVYLILHFT